MSSMSPEQRQGWLDAALGNGPSGTQRSRLAVILDAVLAECDDAGAAAFRAACDTFRRIDARAGGMSTVEMARRWGTFPGEALSATEQYTVRP